MQTLPLYLPIIDTALLVGVGAIFWRRISVYHPLFVYMFFHAYSFSWRAWQIYLGAPTMYTGATHGAEQIAISEITRALWHGDLALTAFALGTWLALERWSSLRLPGATVTCRMLSAPLVYTCTAFSFAAGAAFFVILRGATGGQFVAAAGGFSNYALSSTMWPLTCIGIFYYMRQKMAALALVALPFLVLTATQGYHRFMVVLPLLCYAIIHLNLRGKKWPGPALLLCALAGLLAFPNLKHLGRAVQQGDYDLARQHLVASFTSESVDDIATSNEGFLDQYAGWLTMVDDYGKFEYGRTYTFVLTLPIPRAYWPEKPGLADDVIERTSRARPYATEGRIITYLGQAYVNFGMLGILLVPLLLGYLFSAFYEKATHAPHYSLARLALMFLVPSLIQAYRDGLSSVILFGLAFNMPIIFIWFAHLSMPVRSVPAAGGTQLTQ